LVTLVVLIAVPGCMLNVQCVCTVLYCVNHYFASGGVRSIVMSMFVSLSLSVHLHNSETTFPNFTKFFYAWYYDCFFWYRRLLPAHPGCPRQNPKSRKTVVCVCVLWLWLSPLLVLLWYVMYVRFCGWRHVL